MKFLIALLILLYVQTSFGQNLIFTNANLKSYLLTEYCVDLNGDEIADTLIDVNKDNEIQLSEALSIYNLVISPIQADTISELADLSQFTNLKRLSVFGGNYVLENVSNLNLDSLVFIRISDISDMTLVDLSDLENLKTVLLESLYRLKQLNIQNGSYASDNFSLFYTDIEHACVDSIAAEYTYVAQHIVSGGSISINCALAISEPNSKQVVIYPNPTTGLIRIKEKFEFVKLYDLSGRLIRKWDYNQEVLDISMIERGSYVLVIEGSNQGTRVKKIVKI